MLAMTVTVMYLIRVTTTPLSPAAWPVAADDTKVPAKGGRAESSVLHPPYTHPSFRLIFLEIMRLNLHVLYVFHARCRGMRKLMLVVALVALAVPVAAYASGTPSAASTANQICKQAQASMGALVAQTYATNASKSNAFGKCVAKNTSAAQQDVSNASKTCTSQQADPNFAGSHGGKTFEQFYGNNASKGKGSAANAFGKCVSLAVSKSVTAQAQSLTTAAKSCKAALKASSTAFASSYGTSKSAFGKCVAAAASKSK
jgi:hypothetical protein